MSETQFDFEKTVKALRDVNEKLEEAKKSGTATSDTLATLQKEFNALSTKLDKQEDQNQELIKKLSEEKEQQKALKDQIDTLEKQISRYGTSNPSYKEKSHGIKALENFLAYGVANEVTKSYLRTDNNINGGFLMKPEDIGALILKPITEITRLRQPGGARVRRVNSLKAGEIIRDFLVNTFWTKEGAANTVSNSRYGKVNIFVHSQTGEVEYTQEAVLDSMFDLENEIQSDLVERFAQQEGAAFVNGTGVGMPLGFMNASAGVPRVNSGIANSFDFDSLIALTGELKTGYNPMFGMQRRTVAFTRTLKATDGQYYWQPSGSAGVPNTLVGVPYMEIPDMPAYDGTTAGAENVVYADFTRMYEIVDAYQAIVQRDPFTKGSEGKIIMRMHRFVGGGVIMPEAGVILKNQT
jgi:HK97 family phage major capsid protein